MNTRLRGLLIFLGSSVLAVLMGWLLFTWEAAAVKGAKIPALPFALPLVGMLWGLLELITGRRFKELDAWYQTIPMWIGYPVGCITLSAMLVGCIMLILAIMRLFTS